MYLRVREVLALAADYSPADPESRAFFQTIQSKLHFAVTGRTAPELIAERADSAQPNMGLTSWKGGRVRKSDVTVAKNYLREEEIAELNRIVVMFLDFAEDQAKRRQQIFLRTWKSRLDDFLRFNERAILRDGGKITRRGRGHRGAAIRTLRRPPPRPPRSRRGSRPARAARRRGEEAVRNEDRQAPAVTRMKTTKNLIEVVRLFIVQGLSGSEEKPRDIPWAGLFHDPDMVPAGVWTRRWRSTGPMISTAIVDSADSPPKAGPGGSRI